MEMIRRFAVTKYAAIAFIAFCFGVLIVSQLTADREIAAPSIDQVKQELESVIGWQKYQRSGEIKVVDKTDLRLASIELSADKGGNRLRLAYADILVANGWSSDGHSGNGGLRQDHYCKGVLRLSVVPMESAGAGTHALYVAWARIRNSRFYCRAP